MRIGIVGAGVSGLTAAWLLEGEHDVVLFEAGDTPGGHARTLKLAAGGEPIAVDTGFQHFSEPQFPLFSRLLRSLGVETVGSPMTCTLKLGSPGRSLVLTPDLTAGPRGLAATARSSADLLRFAVAIARAARLDDWDETVAEFLARLPLGRRFAQRILRPFLAALLGASLSDTDQMSARAAWFFPVGHRAPNPLRPYDFREVRGGVGRYVGALVRELGRTQLRLRAPIAALVRRGPRLGVVDSAGQAELFDRVVVATPAHHAAKLVSAMPQAAELARLLSPLRYMTTQLAIHSDPSVMPRRRADWSAYNVEVRGASSEGTIWLGRRDGRPLFKSWVTHRELPLRGEVVSLSFEHPRMTPEYFEVSRRIGDLQGRGGVLLAGSHAIGVDCHESGVASAIAVARALSPRSARLRRLCPPTSGIGAP